MFELTPEEVESVVSQNVIPHKKYLGGAVPFAFTNFLNSATVTGLTTRIQHFALRQRLHSHGTELLLGLLLLHCSSPPFVVGYCTHRDGH